MGAKRISHLLFSLTVAMASVLALSSCGIGAGGGVVTTGARIFLTQQAYDGNLGGLAGADLKCQNAALAAGLTGTWKAWISTAATSAVSRLVLRYPLIRPSGSTLFSTSTELFSGMPTNYPNENELGQILSTSNVWTATSAAGASLASDCNGWTSNSAAVQGAYGLSQDLGVGRWTEFSTMNCAQQNRIYCLQQ